MKNDSHIKIKRTLDMLLYMSNGFGRTLEEIIDRFQIGESTFYRYLKTFRAVGILINLRAGYYSIEKSSGSYKGLSDLLHFTREESEVLSRALSLIDPRDKFKTHLYEKIHYFFDEKKSPHNLVKVEQSENVLVLNTAIRDKKKVLLKKYRSSSSKGTKDRLVEPFCFVNDFRGVWAYDDEDKKSKTFNVGRCEKVVLFESEKWEYEDLHKKEELDAFRMSGDTKIYIKFTLSIHAANLMQEEHPLSTYFLTYPNESVCFDGWVYNIEGIGRFVLSVVSNVDSIESVELVNFLKNKQKDLSTLTS